MEAGFRTTCFRAIPRPGSRKSADPNFCVRGLFSGSEAPQVWESGQAQLELRRWGRVPTSLGPANPRKSLPQPHLSENLENTCENLLLKIGNYVRHTLVLVCTPKDLNLIEMINHKTHHYTNHITACNWKSTKELQTRGFYGEWQKVVEYYAINPNS